MREKIIRPNIVLGWAIVTASVGSENKTLELNFDQVESEKTFPGLVNTKKSIKYTLFKNAFLIKGDAQKGQWPIVFNKRRAAVDLEMLDKHSYVILVSMNLNDNSNNGENRILIKAAAPKVFFDRIMQENFPVVEFPKKAVVTESFYRVIFPDRSGVQGSLNLIVQKMIRYVEADPRDLLKDTDNHWFVRLDDGEFHPILECPFLPTVGRDLVNQIVEDKRQMTGLSKKSA